MKLAHLITFLGLLGSKCLLAAPQKLPHILPFEDQIKVGKKLTFKTEAAHHFNQESPLSCGEGAIQSLSPTSIDCTYKKNDTYKPFLAVCDDSKKYCKIFRPTIYVGLAQNSTKKLQKKNKTTSSPLVKLQTHNGFKLGNPQEHIDQNFNSSKPKAALLDFFALWCPPCNDLDELIFPTQTFITETKDLEKIKINVDEEESWKLKEKYKIRGYPTLIYLNKKGEEVGRFWGTQSPEVLISWIKKMKRLEEMPLSWAIKQSDPMSLERVVEWNFDLGNNQEVKALTGARSEDWAKKYFLRSELELAVDNKDPKAQEKLLKELIKSFPQDIRFAYWVLDLANINKKEAASLEDQAITQINSWLLRPQESLLEGYSTQDLLILKTDLLEALERKEALKVAQAEAISFFEKELNGGKKISRGRSHILAYYYRETGRLEEAKKIYEALVNDNPKEFTFYHRYARVLNDLKDHQLALIWLEKGAPYMTEGNSRLQYALLKGKILFATQKKNEALQIVDGTLAIAKTPEWEKDSAARLIKDLKKLRDEIESPTKSTNH